MAFSPLHFERRWISTIQRATASASLATKLDEFVSARVCSAPQFQPADSEEIFVVELQFSEAGPGDAGEFEFGLFGGSARFTSFGDVLLSAAGRLNHLVAGAAGTIDIFRTKSDCDVVTKLC